MGFFQYLFLLLPTLVSLFIHCSASPIIQAAIDKNSHAYYNCTRNTTFAANSSYPSNIKTLLDWLSSNGTNIARSYITTVATKNTTLYGMFNCLRDISTDTCQACVTESAKLISSLCSTAKEGIIWYKVCLVRYSDRRFFSTVEESPKISFMDKQDYTGGRVERFNNIVWDTLNDLRSEAANASTKLAHKVVEITEKQKLYGAAWCVSYLSTENCSSCLSDAIADVPTSCCRGKTGGRIYFPSCGVRFELYPFGFTKEDTVSWMPPPPESPHPPLSPLPG